MAAAKGNVRPIGHLTSRERDTFTKQRKPGLTKRPQLWQTDFSTPQTHQQLLQLQQRWRELKQRELTAQQHNRRLLQQFEEAQETLTDMLALTAAMKTIRMEYDWYLEENSLRWQQQLKEKTVAAQKKRMESCPKKAEERVTSCADQPLPPQGFATLTQKMAAPPNPYSSSSDSNQHSSPHLPYMQPCWLLPPQSQMARFPIRVPFQPQGSPHVPLSFLPPNIVPHAHPVQLQHFTSTTADSPSRPRSNPAGRFPLQPDGSWPGGISALLPSALWGQACTGEPPLEMGVTHEAEEDGDISRASSSKKERGSGGRSSRSSQELDIKPVRLCGGLVESSDSSREWSPLGREERRRRKERGRSHCSSSDSSQEAPRHSNAIAAVTVAQSSKSDSPSVTGRSSTSRSTRSRGQAVGSPRMEVGAKESHRDDPGSPEEESPSTSEEVHSLVEEPGSEKAQNQSPDDDKSQSSGEESGSQREEDHSGSVSIKSANCSGDGIQEVEGSSSEQCSDGEKVGKDLGDGEDDEEDGKSQTDEEQDERNEDVSERENTTQEEETGEEEDAMEGEDENGKKGFAFSEKEEDESEDEQMEDGESEEEKQRGDVAEPAEERDSDNSIVVIAQGSTKRMHVIEEEASEEEEEESQTGSSDSDDVENLLAVHTQQKEIKEPRADEKPKEFSDNMEVFQEKLDMSDHPSDSDEFDHFYS